MAIKNTFGNIIKPSFGEETQPIETEGQTVGDLLRDKFPSYESMLRNSFTDYNIKLGLYNKYEKELKNISATQTQYKSNQFLTKLAYMFQPWRVSDFSKLGANNFEIPEEVKQNFDSAKQEWHRAEWRYQLTNIMPMLLMDSASGVDTLEAALSSVPNSYMTADDMEYAKNLFSQLSNLIPEESTAETVAVTDTGANVPIKSMTSKELMELLSGAGTKLPLAAVHDLTVEELAKSFQEPIVELPEGITTNQIREVLVANGASEADAEKLTSVTETAKNLAAAWVEKAQQAELLQATMTDQTFEHVSAGEWVKMFSTQPAMFLSEALTAWTDNLSKPIAGYFATNMPSWLYGATTGAVGGAAAGAAITAWAGPGAGVGAIIGGIAGAITGGFTAPAVGKEWFKDLDTVYADYKENGTDSWTAYSKAFDEAEGIPWVLGLYLETVSDPTSYIGLGIATKAATKIPFIGKAISTPIGAIEKGWLDMWDAPFKVVRKGLSKIPKTPAQSATAMSKNYVTTARSLIEHTYPTRRGGIKDVTYEEAKTVLEDSVDFYFKNPRIAADTYNGGVGAQLSVYPYMEKANVKEWAKKLGSTVDDFSADAVYNLNDNFNRYVTGFLESPEQTASVIAESVFGRVGTQKELRALAKLIEKRRTEIIAQAKSRLKGDSVRDILYTSSKDILEVNTKRLSGNMYKLSNSMGKITAWSRWVDKYTHSALVAWTDRHITTSMANQYLMFTGYGVMNVLENAMRSFLGGAEVFHPKGVDPTDFLQDITRGLTNRPYELTFHMPRLQSAITTNTGEAIAYKGGLKYFTKPGEKGINITVGNKRQRLSSYQDAMVNLPAEVSTTQTNQYLGSKYMQKLRDTDGMKAVSSIVRGNESSMLPKEGLRGYGGKQGTKDMVNYAEAKATLSPADVRDLISPISVQENYNAGARIAKYLEKLTDIPQPVKQAFLDDAYSGKLWKDGEKGILEKVNQGKQVARELDSYSVLQMEQNLRDIESGLLETVPKTVDELMFQMKQFADLSACSAGRISDLRKATRKAASLLKHSERDKFYSGSWENLKKYLDTSEESFASMQDELAKRIRAMDMTPEQIDLAERLVTIADTRIKSVLKVRQVESDRFASKPATFTSSEESSAWWSETADIRDSAWNKYWDANKYLTADEMRVREGLTSSIQNLTKTPLVRVKGNLTPDNVATLWGTTGDGLSKGIFKSETEYMTLMGREEFVSLTLAKAEVSGSTGFTRSGVEKVYDQVLSRMGLDPKMAEPLLPMMTQFDEAQQEFSRILSTKRLPQEDYDTMTAFLNKTADDLEGLEIYGAGKAITDWETKPQVLKYKHTIKDIENIASGSGTVKLYHGTTAESALEIVSKGMKIPYKVEDLAKEVASKYGLTYKEFSKYVHRKTELVNSLSTAPAPVASRWAQHFSKGEILSDINSQARILVEAKRIAASSNISVSDAFEQVYNEGLKIAKNRGIPGSLMYVPDMLNLPDKYKSVVGTGALVEFEVDIEKLPAMVRKNAKLDYDSYKEGAITDDELLQDWNHTYQDIRITPDMVKSSNIVIKDIPNVSSYSTDTLNVATDDWMKTKDNALLQAREQFHLDFPDYDNFSAVSAFMRTIFPFWTYEWQRYFWLPRTFLRQPGIMSGLGRYMDYSDDGYVEIPGTDLQINPFRGTVFAGGMRRLYMKDYPEYYDSFPGMEVIDYISRFGFYPGVHVMFPIVAVGAGTGKPEWSELAPSWLRTGFDAVLAVATDSVAATLSEQIFPDRFRSYITILSLSADGISGVDLWDKIKTGKATPEDKATWGKYTKKAAGLKGVLMEQTGLFRLRPEEYTQFKESSMKLVEEMTGISIDEQRQISKMYPITGRKLSDYVSLSPLQQKILYELEAYDIWSGVTSPLQPSSWQAEDREIREYWDAVENLYTKARTTGFKDSSGKTEIPSVQQINQLWIDGSINASQWVSLRSESLTRASNAVSELKESAYQNVPTTLAEREARFAERGIPSPTYHPGQEMLWLYYDQQPEWLYDWETGTFGWDYSTYYATTDAIIELLPEPYKTEFLETIQYNWTPLEQLYWTVSREYIRAYNSSSSVIMSTLSPEEQAVIKQYQTAVGAEREALANYERDGVKLVSWYTEQLRTIHDNLRKVDPELDAWLMFFGKTSTVKTKKAQELYDSYRSKYLTQSMVS